MSIATVVLRGYGPSGDINFLPTLGYGAFTIDAPPTIPGVEYSVGRQRPHYHVVNTRPHYTVPNTRPHYRSREET
jgi:hypothetical protein